jgi:hypothetical protein
MTGTPGSTRELINFSTHPGVMMDSLLHRRHYG